MSMPSRNAECLFLPLLKLVNFALPNVSSYAKLYITAASILGNPRAVADAIDAHRSPSKPAAYGLHPITSLKMSLNSVELADARLPPACNYMPDGPCRCRIGFEIYRWRCSIGPSFRELRSLRMLMMTLFLPGVLRLATEPVGFKPLVNSKGIACR